MESNERRLDRAGREGTVGRPPPPPTPLNPHLRGTAPCTDQTRHTQQPAARLTERRAALDRPSREQRWRMGSDRDRHGQRL